MKRYCLLSLLSIILLTITGCASDNSQAQAGYYTAEAASFDEYGWKEYITIYYSNDRIVNVEYNAKNSSGFIKSWDMSYMKIMKAVSGTYPNEYTRSYSESLLRRQSPTEVDAISGATHSFDNFLLLSDAVIAKAKAGDKSIAYVEFSSGHE